MKEFQVTITVKCTDTYLQEDGKEFFKAIESNEMADDLLETPGIEEVNVEFTKPKKL